MCAPVFYPSSFPYAKFGLLCLQRVQGYRMCLESTDSSTMCRVEHGQPPVYVHDRKKYFERADGHKKKIPKNYTHHGMTLLFKPINQKGKTGNPARPHKKKKENSHCRKSNNKKKTWSTFTNLFLFSTSSTSSSVENWPLTTRISCLMMSSAQSTSSRPPTTTGRREGFTCNNTEVLLIHCKCLSINQVMTKESVRVYASAVPAYQ